MITSAASVGVRRTHVRRFWLLLHRWLGLLLGAWFLLLGLTGSVLVFYRGLDELLDARVAPRAGVSALPAMEAAYQALLAAHPQRGSGWRLEVPWQPGEVVTARYLKPAETVGQGFAPLLTSVDPLTLQVVANRFWGDHAGTWLYNLHYTLLLGDLGQQLVGWCGVGLALSLGTGLWLWWPAPGHWRHALHFKRQAAAVRRVYDLHKLSGLWGGALLLVLAVTGAALALPHLAKPAIAAFSPLSPPTAVPAATAGGPRLSLDELVRRATAPFPGSVARWVDMPAKPGDACRVRLRQVGEPGDRFPDTLVWLDPVSGAVLAVRNPAHGSAGDTVWRWMHPLHSGEAFRLPGRLIVFASGVLPLLLAVTGWLRWRDKRRARRAAPQRLPRMPDGLRTPSHPHRIFRR